MIDPRNVCLYIPNGLKKFKLDLFERTMMVARSSQRAGASIVETLMRFLNWVFRLSQLLGAVLNSETSSLDGEPVIVPGFTGIEVMPDVSSQPGFPEALTGGITAGTLTAFRCHVSERLPEIDGSPRMFLSHARRANSP